MPGPNPDVVVVGGGVIGLSIAWRSAEAGLSVVLVDPRPGHGATWAAAGMLAPVTEAHYGEEHLLDGMLAGARAWPSFAADVEAASGRSVGYRHDGTTVVAVDPSDRAAVDEITGFQASLGLDVARLSARQCRQAEPALAPGIAGGADVPVDHQVDNRLLVYGLLGACGRAGVAVVADEAAGLLTGAGSPGPVEGVALAGGGEVRAPTVVLAAGSRSGSFPGVADGVLPEVRPVKGLTLRLEVPPGVPGLRRTVRGLVHGTPCYLVPRNDGSMVVGATVEERGDDLSVQAGAVHQLLRDARTLLPAVDEYVLVESVTGLRPCAPDNRPVVGPTAVDGLVVATGHYRNGILLAPVTADAVVALLVARR